MKKNNIKIGTMIKIIASHPTPQQNLVDLNLYIGEELPVLEHWKQKYNEDLEVGEVFVSIDKDNVGRICLNKDEYEVIEQ